jgi:hypothetical protein
MFMPLRLRPQPLYVCDILLQLLTTCESRTIMLAADYASNDFPVSGLALSHFLMHSNRTLKVLRVNSLRLDACHCHAIDTSTRMDLQIDLNEDVEVTDLGENILLESIRQNRGPTGLHSVDLVGHRLADALRGNSRVTSFSPYDSNDETALALFQALAENEGIVKFDDSQVTISDENWDALWQSVSCHPKLEIIKMSTSELRGIPDAEKTRRTQSIVDALRVNTVLHTIGSQSNDWDFGIMDNMVRPRLLVNRYRPRVAAIAEERGTWQRKLLGRALASVSCNPSLNPIWMMVSGNVDVICGDTPGE